MGGKIFQSQGIESSRIDLDKYSELCNQIYDKLGHLFNLIHIIQPFAAKNDFGDIDTILAAPKDTYISWDKQIIAAYPDCKIARNSDEISILVEGKYQLDFRIIKKKYWETSVLFSDYDPISNNLGRVARFLGLRFGYDGLSYPIYTENGCNKLEKISVCRDPRKIYEFFGLNYDKWLEGFLTKEEIFDFTVSSKFYSIICFNPENWDHATRTRNKKRQVFCEFVEWANKNHNYEKFQFAPKDQKDIYIPLISDFFGIDLQSLINFHREKYKKDLELYEKWNGHICMGLTGLKNKELGMCLAAFREFAAPGGADFKIFLENHSAQNIEEKFLTWYENSYKLEK